MHHVEISQEVIDRILGRRGRMHIFDSLAPEQTALIVVDMQNFFVEPGAPAEVPVARDICPNINELARELRTLGARVIWVTTAYNFNGGTSDCEYFLRNIVGDSAKIERLKEALKYGAHGTEIWQDLEVLADDLQVIKNRYSAFIAGSSNLERLLRSSGIENLLFAGTGTSVCVESSARDAMMLDFNCVLVSDCCAHYTDREHLATLEIFIQQFGDVMTKDEALATVQRKTN